MAVQFWTAIRLFCGFPCLILVTRAIPPRSSGERRLRRRTAHILSLRSDECRLVGEESASYRCTPVGGFLTGAAHRFRRSAPVSRQLQQLQSLPQIPMRHKAALEFAFR
jgi:hypothetical protein